MYQIYMNFGFKVTQNSPLFTTIPHKKSNFGAKKIKKSILENYFCTFLGKSALYL